MAPLALRKQVLKSWRAGPAAVLEASREKTSGTQDSKEQKRLSLSGKGEPFFYRRSMEDEPFLKKEKKRR